ncbi:SIS domain-containing protein [Phreatobacter stygius]|uniref:SIS domain-containing protein n=1 Tax=Phreatobacter stygius TaxID=1940610 RepID=A0A4D7AZK3_9HYPH|nr:SIS domain-containing protein [Phreatobacter stygius]QCI63180.1 SIS domain-containing protein [Phreatobacter stygius]
MLDLRQAGKAAHAGHFQAYSARLGELLSKQDWTGAVALADDLVDCWKTGRQVFLIGNGGAGGSAVHLANDFMYPISKRKGSGLRVHSLLANPAIVTCIANDEGYDQIFAYQLAVQANPGDVLIAISGSGNSNNILVALEEAKRIGMRSYALVGFSGGKAKELADVSVHFETNDMQLAEDAQMILGHMLMQHLYSWRDDLGL